MKPKPKRSKVTWLGNSHKREFHRCVAGQPQPPGCKLDRIAIAHRRPSRTARELREAGYDACAFCTTSHFKSRENT